MLGINATLAAQLFNFLILIAILIIVPILFIKLILSRTTYFKNIEKIALELTQIRRILEKEKVSK